MDLADLSIFPTNPDQVRVHRERTWEQWGGSINMSCEEFVKRDLIYADLPHSVNGKFVVWILSPRQNAAENKDFLASCETFQRECVVSKSVVHEDLEGPMISYGINAVLTPPHHRGKGYAKHMMRLLHYVLAGDTGTTTLPTFPTGKWGEPPRIPPGFGKGIASALYSDVGSEFYKSCGKGLVTDNGWVTRQPSGTIWTVPQDGRAHDVLPSSMEWITKEEQHAILEEDASLIRREISTSSTPSFAFLPDQGVATYHQNRSEFLSPERSSRGVWGAKLLDRSDQTDERGGAMGHRRLSFATWALDPGGEGPQNLLITRLRCTQEEFPVLLNAAFRAARMFDLEKVEIWNLDPSLKQIGEGVLGGVTVERNDHLPSLAWYGEVDEASVVWRYNEYFCQC